MPGQLINNTLSNISAGVSEQYQEGRFDSQVDKMINCMPSITRGVLRRNPVEAVGTLAGLPVDLSTSFVYSYDRGTSDEQYIIVVPGDGIIHTYNANTGGLLYSSPYSDYLKVTGIAKHSFKAMTIGDLTFIVNQTIKTAFLEELTDTRGYSDMAFYWIKKTASVVTEQYTSVDQETGSLLKGYDYTLNSVKIEGTEDTRPTSTNGYTQDNGVDEDGFAYPDTVVPAAILPGTGIDMNTSFKIAAEFAANSGSSLAPNAEGATCYNHNFTGTDWKWEDTFGNQASLGVWKTTTASDKLPVTLPFDLDKFIVKVVGNSSSEFDDYYLQYSYENKTWKEISSPGKKYKLNASTMPHVLYRTQPHPTTEETFEFGEYKEVLAEFDVLNDTWLGDVEWGERHTGGDKAIDDPSFIGLTITNIFFHKNRLGFITDDTIVLSQSGLYGDFFFQTLQNVLDDDPIDLAVASTDVTILRHAVSTSGQLIIFSDDTQFNLQSLDGPLTPNTADITPLSKYTYGSVAEAKAIGNKVYFTNQVGKYSQVYAYTVSDKGSQITEANNMTIHLPTYVDKSTARILGHDVLGYTFIEQEDKPYELIVLTNVTKSGEDLQNAFHKWAFSKKIISTHIINNSLYILFDDASLTKIELDIPGSISDVHYMDNYNGTEGEEAYDSIIEFSEFFYRQEGKGTVRGRYQIRTLQYTIEDDSKYVTYLQNTGLSLLNPLTMHGPLWDDTDAWDDTKIWVDIDPNYIREYINDDKVTVMTNSKVLRVAFRSSVDEPNIGFELATINIEGFFFQRSQRVQ